MKDQLNMWNRIQRIHTHTSVRNRIGCRGLITWRMVTLIVLFSALPAHQALAWDCGESKEVKGDWELEGEGLEQMLVIYLVNNKNVELHVTARYKVICSKDGKDKTFTSEIECDVPADKRYAANVHPLGLGGWKVHDVKFLYIGCKSSK